MCIFHVVNLKARPWVQNLFGTRMLKHQSIHKIVHFCMLIETKEMKHVLNRMTQFTMVLSSDFQLVTLVSSFIVGTSRCAHVWLMNQTKFMFANINICVREIDRLKQSFL